MRKEKLLEYCLQAIQSSNKKTLQEYCGVLDIEIDIKDFNYVLHFKIIKVIVNNNKKLKFLKVLIEEERDAKMNRALYID